MRTDVTRTSSLAKVGPNRPQLLLIGLCFPDLAPVCSGLGGVRCPPQLESSWPGPRALKPISPKTREAGLRKPGPGFGLPVYAREGLQRHRHRPSQGTGFAVSSGMLTVPWSTALGVVLGRSFTSSCDQTLSLLLARGFLESRGGTSHFCCGAETPAWSASARFRAVPGHMC